MEVVMNKEELRQSAQKLAEAVAAVMPADFTVEGGLCTKKNDHEVSYVKIQSPGIANEEGDKVAFRFYVNETIYDIDHGYKSYEEAAQGLKDSFNAQYSTEVNAISSKIMGDKNIIKEYVICELVNFEMNKWRLAEEDIVYEQFLDLAIIFRVVVFEDQNERKSYPLTNFLLKKSGLTKEELFEIAKNNTLLRRGVNFVALGEVLNNIVKAHVGDELDDLLGTLGIPIYGYPMYMLSNAMDHGSLGAAVILLENVMEKIAKKIGDFYILPSSVHECIIVPTDSYMDDPEFLKELVNEANDTAVLPEDFLSGSIYRYEAASKKITIVE